MKLNFSRLFRSLLIHALLFALASDSRAAQIEAQSGAVFNFEIAREHAGFFGNAGVLAHNTSIKLSYLWIRKGTNWFLRDPSGKIVKSIKAKWPFDEPTSIVDPEQQRRGHGALQRLSLKEHGIQIVPDYQFNASMGASIYEAMVRKYEEQTAEGYDANPERFSYTWKRGSRISKFPPYLSSMAFVELHKAERVARDSVLENSAEKNLRLVKSALMVGGGDSHVHLDLSRRLLGRRKLVVAISVIHGVDATSGTLIALPNVKPNGEVELTGQFAHLPVHRMALLTVDNSDARIFGPPAFHTNPANAARPKLFLRFTYELSNTDQSWLSRLWRGYGTWLEKILFPHAQQKNVSYISWGSPF